MKRIDIRELEIRHHLLDREIHELDRRAEHMTPSERFRAAELKRQRVVTKDQIVSLQSR
jgi:hypothetical protein